MVVHNHPSGNPEPSRADKEVTTKLIQAGNILDISLLDHLIIGFKSIFRSIPESLQAPSQSCPATRHLADAPDNLRFALFAQHPWCTVQHTLTCTATEVHAKTISGKRTFSERRTFGRLGTGFEWGTSVSHQTITIRSSSCTLQW